MPATIVVVRHPEKDGDKITPHGAEQAFAAALALGERFKNFEGFDRLIHSGAHRAWQALRVMAAALGLKLPDEERSFLNFTATLTQTLGSSDAFYAEVAKMKAAEGTDRLTLAMALRHSEFARQGRQIMINGLLGLACDMAMRGQATALTVSHSPWLELASFDTENTPYGIGESDAVIYVVAGDEILVGSELVRAPLPGKPLF
ncbi:hypothetical protein HZB93_00290 [Candidatus Falkowbacteria bacterium]|nr:hypothetical protein [Candidatus Falkowbacteria bacterium]